VRVQDFTAFYKLGDTIADGSYFTVYKCTRLSDGKSFAAKWFKERNETAYAELSNSLYLKEEQACCFLQCYDIFDKNDNLFLVYELMDGGNLHYHLRANEYSARQAQYIVYNTLRSLKCLHDRQMLHRDICSKNVLWNAEGDVKLCDLSSATLLTETNSRRNDDSGSLHY